MLFDDFVDDMVEIIEVATIAMLQSFEYSELNISL